MPRRRRARGRPPRRREHGAHHLDHLGFASDSMIVTGSGMRIVVAGRLPPRRRSSSCAQRGPSSTWRKRGRAPRRWGRSRRRVEHALAHDDRALDTGDVLLRRLCGLGDRRVGHLGQLLKGRQGDRAVATARFWFQMPREWSGADRGGHRYCDTGSGPGEWALLIPLIALGSALEAIWNPSKGGVR